MRPAFLRGRRHRERPEPGYAPPTARGRALFAEYPWLARLAPRLSPATIEESLGALDLLDRVGEGIGPAPVADPGSRARYLDVGAKDWRVLPGLAAFLARRAGGAAGAEPAARPFSVTGAEIKPWRLHLDGRTPFSVASHLARLCADEGPCPASYEPVDARAIERPAQGFAGVTWLFPFVSPGPHRAWGLPARVFDPEGLARHVESLLAAGGWLVTANQGEWEWELQKGLFKTLRPGVRRVVEGSLHASPHPLFVTLWR